MIKADEEALICDLAETYRIYDYRQLPAVQVAVFSAGLHDSSRIKLKLSGQKVPMETLLLAGLYDKVNLLIWSKTENGQKGVNRPISITEELTSTQKERKEQVFDSGEEFERVRKSLLKLSGGN